MAKFIIIRGKKDSGKTTTAGLVFIELLKISELKHLVNGKDVVSNSLEYNSDTGDLKDFSAILTINSKKIAIISAGDEVNPLANNINDFIANNINIIICCARSRNVKGSTYRMIIDTYTKDHQILKEIWVYYSIDKEDKDVIKKASVFEIFEIVNKYVK